MGRRLIRASWKYFRRDRLIAASVRGYQRALRFGFSIPCSHGGEAQQAKPGMSNVFHFVIDGIMITPVSLALKK